LRAAADARVQRLARRVHVVDSRPAFAGFRARLAMRDRRASELSHALMRLARAATAVRARRVQALERQLATFDVGRRLARTKARGELQCEVIGTENTDKLSRP